MTQIVPLPLLSDTMGPTVTNFKANAPALGPPKKCIHEDGGRLALFKKMVILVLHFHFINLLSQQCDIISYPERPIGV